MSKENLIRAHLINERVFAARHATCVVVTSRIADPAGVTLFERVGVVRFQERCIVGFESVETFTHWEFLVAWHFHFLSLMILMGVLTGFATRMGS